MPKDHSAELMNTLIAKLYTTLTGDDENIKMPRNKFVTWLLPGIPFDPVDFRYCVKGFNGETADEIKENYQQAFTLSKIFDLIPDVSREFTDQEMQQTIWTSTQDSISSVYRDVLKYSRVLDNELSEKEKAKIQKFRDLLTVTTEEEDIMTEEMKTVTKPGKLTLAYTDKMNEYIKAADEYMNLKIEYLAATGDSPEAKRRVHEYTLKNKFKRKSLEAAEMAWVSQGYKTEYEKINAYINHVNNKSMVLYKQDLINKFNHSLLTAEGGDFYYTTLLPASFATSTGWTKFEFSHADYECHYKKKTSKWGAKGGLNLGLFSVGGSAGSEKSEVTTDTGVKEFRATLEFTQAVICRPGFEPGLFFMRSWTLDDTWNLNWNKNISDGKEEPDGRLVAYPVTALFVRNLEFTLAESDKHTNFKEKSLTAGGSVGYGPFSVGGSYSNGSIKKDIKSTWGKGKIEVPGMQLIGFINNIFPECPNLNPDIKPEQLV